MLSAFFSLSRWFAFLSLLVLAIVHFPLLLLAGDRPFSSIASRGRSAIFFYCFSRAISHFLLLLLAGGRPFHI